MSNPEIMQPKLPTKQASISTVPTIRPSIFLLSDRPAKLDEETFLVTVADLWKKQKNPNDPLPLLGLQLRFLRVSLHLGNNQYMAHAETYPIYLFSSYQTVSKNYERRLAHHLHAEIIFPFPSEDDVALMPEQAAL
jgi:hypothetical protein